MSGLILFEKHSITLFNSLGNYNQVCQGLKVQSWPKKTWKMRTKMTVNLTIQFNLKNTLWKWTFNFILNLQKQTMMVSVVFNAFCISKANVWNINTEFGPWKWTMVDPFEIINKLMTETCSLNHYPTLFFLSKWMVPILFINKMR